MVRLLGLWVLCLSLSGCVEGAPDQVHLEIAESALGQWSTESIAGMQTWLYVPEGPPVLGEGRALMVNLHGCAQQADALKNDGNWTPTAEAHGMIVAVPAVPGGGVLFGCWDYYGANHTRTNRHNGALLDLVSELLARPELSIDPRQVYISGLSSGSGQAMVMGCLAPDVFAGVGLNAGPTIGTASSEIALVATTEARATALCRQLAADQAPWFDTQVASIIHGDNDFTVNTDYNLLNAQVMAAVYGATQGPEPFDTAALAGAAPQGSGQLWSDGQRDRVSLIENTGLGHNWPAGQGGLGGVFVAKNSLDYPAYLTTFLFENNARASGNFNTPEPEPALQPDPQPQPTPSPDPVQPDRGDTDDCSLSSDCKTIRIHSSGCATTPGTPTTPTLPLMLLAMLCAWRRLCTAQKQAPLGFSASTPILQGRCVSTEEPTHAQTALLPPPGLGPVRVRRH